MPAEIKIEDVGPCKKRLRVTVPKEDVKAKLDEAYNQLMNTVVLPGFRKGRVPRKLMERRFGDEVTSEVKQGMMAEAVQEALKKNDLWPVGEPKFENVEFDVEKALSFEVTLEVLPTVHLPEYKGLKLNRKSAEPTDEDIYNAIQDLRRRAAVLTTVDGPAEKGDLVICDYEVKVGDQVVASAQDAEIAADGRNVVGISPEPVAKLLIGSKAGDVRFDIVRLTDQFSREDMRGKEAQVRFSIKEVKRAMMPEVDEEFARKAGYGTVADMREILRDLIRARKEEWVKLDLERQVCDELVAAVNLELPQELLKRQTEENYRTRRTHLMLHGIPPEQMEAQKDALMKACEEEAVRDIKIYLILNAIGDKEKIFATEDDVKDEIARRAMRMGMTPARLKSQLEAEGRMSSLRTEIRHKKVLAFLVEHAQIVDVKKAITEAPEAEEEKKRLILTPADATPREEPETGKKLILTPEEAMREAESR